jgi:hypothetical protein
MKDEAYILETRGEKFVCIPDRVKNILEDYGWIEFNYKNSKFAIIKFEDFIPLLQKWKDTRIAVEK